MIAGPVEIRRVYQISIGSWSQQIEVPDWLDLNDVADRVRGFFGMMVILAVAVFLSDNRRAISGASYSGGFSCSGPSRYWCCGCPLGSSC